MVSRRNRFAGLLSLLAVLCLLHTAAVAGEARKGTITLSGSSDMFFRHATLDDDTVDTYDAGIGIGYFVSDRVEIGTAITFARQESEYRDDSYADMSYGVDALISYRIPTGARLDWVFEVGAGIIQDEWEYADDYSDDLTGIQARTFVGCEFFLNPHVALRTGVTLRYIDWGLVESSMPNETEISYSPGLGLRIFL